MNEKKKIDVVVYKITTDEEQKIRNMFEKMNFECAFKQALDENGNVCKDGQVSFMKMPEDSEDTNNEIFDKLFGLFWSMSSLGNFIGATFDLCDGKYDGYFRIYVRG